MDLISVDVCPAGIALDLAVEELRQGCSLVLDKERRLIATSVDRLRQTIESGWIGWEGSKDTPAVFCLELPKYSTDMVAAFTLVLNPPESENHVYLPSITQHEAGDWLVSFGRMSPIAGHTLPLAITRAYLKARGVTEIRME